MIIKSQAMFYMPTATSPGLLATEPGTWLDCTVAKVTNQEILDLYVKSPVGVGVVFAHNVPVGAGSDGYCVVSKTPVVVTYFGIGQAVTDMKAGKKVRRKSWPSGVFYAAGTKVRLNYNDIVAEDWSLA